MNHAPVERMEYMDEGRDQELDALIGAVPEGWSRAQIAGQIWGVTRTTRAGGKVISVDAERLGDTERLGRTCGSPLRAQFSDRVRCRRKR
jgi:hypothetical protein